MKNKLFTLAVLMVFVSPMAPACDSCSVFSACDLSSENEKGFFAGFAEQYTHFGTLQEDGRKISGDGEYIDSLVSQIFAGLHARATVVAGSIAAAPKRANVNGCRGTRRTGWEASANNASKCDVIGSNTRRHR